MSNIPSRDRPTAAQLSEMWQVVAANVSRIEPNSLVVVYVRAQMQDQMNSMPFRMAAESVLFTRITILNPASLFLLSRLNASGNRQAVLQLAQSARERLQSLPLVFPASMVNNSGPSIGENRGGGRPLTPQELSLNTRNAGNPLADNLEDYLGTPQQLRSYHALRDAGPFGSLAAAITFARGGTTEQALQAIAVCQFGDGLISLHSPSWDHALSGVRPADVVLPGPRPAVHDLRTGPPMINPSRQPGFPRGRSR